MRAFCTCIASFTFVTATLFGCGDDSSSPSTAAGGGSDAGGVAGTQGDVLPVAGSESALGGAGGAGGESNVTAGAAGMAMGGTDAAGGACPCAATEGCCDLVAALVHRYTFNGSGATAEDLVGDADGMVVGTELADTGSVDFNGNGQYVDLPNGMLSALGNATFEAWVTINPGNGLYARILDLGSSTAGEGGRDQGASFLFLTPGTGDNDMMRVAYSLNGGGGEIVIDAPYIGPNVLTHVAVVFDDDADTMHLFRDGVLQGSVTVEQPLSAIVDNNNWLGRSQFSFDADLNGSISEFRIYGSALSAAQLELSAELGPDFGM